MKKVLVFLILYCIMSFAFSQYDSTIPKSSVTNIETYEERYSYVKDEPKKITFEKTGNLYTSYKYPSNFTSSYGDYTPGELLNTSGKMKNAAITVITITSVVGGTLIGTSLLTENPIVMCVSGGIITITGSVTALVLNIISNKLIREAGMKMEKIQFSANGVTIKF